MAKITICDICKKKGKLIATDLNIRIKGKKDTRIDYCKECEKDIPKDIKKYKELVAELFGYVAPNGNACKYCGKPNGSPDNNVLCPECRETFGHAFYSEL